MPSKSQAQKRAMHAAKAGKSTLGIPKKVGAEFVREDKKAGNPKLPERKTAKKTAKKSSKK